ncbi:MAG: sugar phosphate nucleotidyltransferase [Armatimonadota bacterium]
MSLRAVILAAGMGTRMRPLTLRRPKPLVPVAGRPMIEHIVGGLVSAGVRDICLVIGYLGDQIVHALGDGTRLGARLVYRWQEHFGGTGAAVLLAEDFVGDERFVLGWGDIIIPSRNYRRMIGMYCRERPEAVLSVNVVEDPWEGAAVYVANDHVERIIEKPPKGRSSTHYNNAGLFVFGPELLGILRRTPLSPRGELEVPSAVMSMLQGGARIRAFEIEGYWSDVARPASAIAVSGEIIRDASHAGVLTHPTARVCAQASLRPPVLVGPDAVVEAASLGPNVTVMAGAQIAAGARLHDAMVFAGAHVGEGCVLSHAIVEEWTEVAGGTCAAGSREEAIVLGGT